MGNRPHGLQRDQRCWADPLHQTVARRRCNKSGTLTNIDPYATASLRAMFRAGCDMLNCFFNLNRDLIQMLLSRTSLSAFAASVLLLTACGGSDDPSTKGAIALSNSTGKAAIVWNAVDQSTANDQARSGCGGGDCQVLLQFSACGAISTDFNRNIVGVAEAATAAAAQQAADSSCTGKGGRSCFAPASLTAKCNE